MILGQSAPPVVDKLGLPAEKNQVISAKNSKPANINILVGILPLLLSTGASILIYNKFKFFDSDFIYPASSLPLLIGFIALGSYFYINRRFNEQVQIAQKLLNENKSCTDTNIQLESIMQSIEEGFITTDLKGIVTLINKNASQILKKADYNILNQPITNVLFIEDVRGKIIKDYQMELDSPTGSKIMVKISSFPLVSAGMIRGTIYIINDITEESELAKMKLDFVAQAAHQLRTPLTILRSYLSVFRDKVSPQLGEEDKMYLDRSMLGANQLADLIENLLSVSKIEQNKLELKLAPTQMEQVITQALTVLQDEAKNKDITIHLQTQQLPPVLADGNLIGQVIQNLVKNAIDYSQKGGQVIAQATVQGTDVVVTVIDSGVGIPSEATSSLFTKFFKVTGKLQQESKGMGMGLYNAKAIVEAHHGKIWVNSILGKGSSFGFSLPINLTQ
jgi:signal transduction histidine kinase